MKNILTWSAALVLSLAFVSTAQAKLINKVDFNRPGETAIAVAESLMCIGTMPEEKHRFNDNRKKAIGYFFDKSQKERDFELEIMQLHTDEMFKHDTAERAFRYCQKWL